MKKKRASSPAFVVVVFFLFVLLHQTDKLLIGSLQLPVSKTFGLNDLQWGFVNTGALIVGTIFYPIWGYLYDRYARAKLLALASLIWGATTWLSSIVRTYPSFLLSRSSTGIDNSAYPGVYSLVGDYFAPKNARQDLWHPTARPAAGVFNRHDPGPDHCPNDGWQGFWPGRLARDLFDHRSAGNWHGGFDLFWGPGRAARPVGNGV